MHLFITQTLTTRNKLDISSGKNLLICTDILQKLQSIHLNNNAVTYPINNNTVKYPMNNNEGAN